MFDAAKGELETNYTIGVKQLGAIRNRNVKGLTEVGG